MTDAPAPPPSPLPGGSPSDALAAIAAEAGLRRVHMIAWRDLDDGESGGSEVHAHEVAQRWAAAGLEVTIRTSRADGRPATGHRDGYRVIRKGGRFEVFPRTVVAGMLRADGRYDGLVEIWNGMPFFSPVWTRTPKVIVLHHIHGVMWKQALPSPLAQVGDVMERKVAPLVYRRRRLVTLSESSQDEILELKYPRHRVDVVPPGVDPFYTPGGTRSPEPLVAHVGRLAPVKAIDRLIDAVALARQQVPDLRLELAGTGPSRQELDRYVAARQAESWVTFRGFISPEEKLDLYRRAWVVASSSTREGWNMSLTEAAAAGTPAVATDIPGHRNAVARDHSGLLAKDEEELASHLVALTTDLALRDRLAAGARDHTRTLDWDATALSVLTALAEERHRWRQRPWRAWRAR